MTVLNRAFSSLVVLGTVLASSAAFAATPFNAATQAQRGQLEGIPSHQALQSAIRSGNVTGEDILEAAGLEANASDANFVESVLRDRSN